MQDELVLEDTFIVFPVPDLAAPDATPSVGRGHFRSLSAPSEITAATAPWDIPPGAFQHLKEDVGTSFRLDSVLSIESASLTGRISFVLQNLQGWKSKAIKKNNWVKTSHSLYDRRLALEEDVAQLQTQLKTERAVRQGLEIALGHGQTSKKIAQPLQAEFPASTYSPKAKQLITEIANLETEVASLEHHVLSLYRKVLDQQICTSPTYSSVSSVQNVPNLSGLSTPTEVSTPSQPRLFSKLSFKRKSSAFTSSHRRNVSTATTTSAVNDNKQENGSGLQSISRHVSLLGGAFNCIDGSSAQETSHQLATSSTVLGIPAGNGKADASSRGTSKREAFLVSPQPTALTLLATGSHSAPASESGFGKYSESPRLFQGTPNRLSEELVRCMAAIYCKLADPPLPASSAPISPSSSSSSSSGSTVTTRSSSPRGFSNDSFGSPRWRGADSNSHSEAASLMDPFQLKDRKGDVVGAYRSAVEVPWICVDKDRLNYAARALRNFRSMVEQLENVDPAIMKQEEKMAFWINIYNALMMHAYLAYGIPRSYLKRLALVQKASYKIGPHSINAHMIEHCILGCRSRRPTQWLQTFFTTTSRFRPGDGRKPYALEKAEPLVCFALCCGSRSDPAVRVYTAKNVRQELEESRRDYLRASIGVRSGNKVILPRILAWYARETSVAPSGLLEWVCQFVSDKQQAAIKTLISSKSQKSLSNCVEWLPYNSRFRYIFVRDLARLVPLTAR
ncbi:hypothetical protein R1sor_018274 [Riccia sorocarpa]|uniref:DUF547 domain-containing protein n=1 Tax=Riccia sorocarpa TaxID=122646 RepID=A0ABD3IBY7_9MARC